MAQLITMKSKPFGKDEVLLLLDHICQHKIITSKATNATNNKLKEDAWKSVAKKFCAMTGEMRRPEQLRLKWENLKKAARKRSALIRQNNLKTGGGKAYIPPDEALDRVASMLGATCTGFIIEFGGDGEELPSTSEVVQEVQDMQPLPELPQAEESILLLGDGIGECGGGSGVGVNDIEANFKSKKFVFNTPKSSSNRNRRQKLSEELQRAQKDKELTMAAYFRAKAEKLELENLKLRLEIEQKTDSMPLVKIVR